MRESLVRRDSVVESRNKKRLISRARQARHSGQTLLTRIFLVEDVLLQRAFLEGFFSEATVWRKMMVIGTLVINNQTTISFSLTHL